jgi:hypothetical protein
MKFQATVTFEFQAGSLGEAGEKLDDALEQAKERGGMEAKSVELRTPLASRQPVALPAVSTEQKPGAPHALGVSA